MEVATLVLKTVEEAVAIHAAEKTLTIRSTLIVGKLEDMRASVIFGLPAAAFAEKIGLSASQYWKRAQAARILRFFPETRQMVENGDTSISVLATISARLTPANAGILLPRIKGKSKREVKELLSVITESGEIIEKEPTVDFKLTLTKSQVEKLDRAIAVLAASGHTPELAQVFSAALEALLWRSDPMQKAERAAKRQERKRKVTLGTAPAQRTITIEKREVRSTLPAPAQQTPPQRRLHIPNGVRHQVWLRDQGRCTWSYPSGERCQEQKMLELDHQTMVCLGGDHSLENLTLRCRFHNQVKAEIVLGQNFMKQKRTPTLRS